MLLRWGLNIAGILVTAYFIEGFEVTFAAAIIGSIILGLVNATLRPLLLILTLPINILTLGLFTLVINGLMLWTVSEVIKGFDISGFWIAFISALIMMIINSVVSMLLKD
ncbi:MAG: phage holin family protein [Peptococcaceae bacterium]|nr:phage holin family protein [Peptococcaceae bacterium]